MSGLLGLAATVGIHCGSRFVLLSWNETYQNSWHLNFSTRKILSLLAAPITLPYLIKKFNILKQRNQLLNLQNLLSSLDAYETAIKKNKIFLQETNLLKSSAAVLEKIDKKNDFAQSLVTSMKNVIDLVYTFIKQLETRSIDVKFELFYEPIEDLQDCELLSKTSSEIDLRTIKVSWNVINLFFGLFFVKLLLLLHFILKQISWGI